MTDIRHILQGAIARAIGELGVTATDIRLEHPEAGEHGDYATNAALRYAKEAEKNPREFAEEIAEHLRAAHDNAIEKIEVAGSGFINFRLSPEFFSNAVGEILKEKDGYGHNKELAGKKIIIEYTDPNPFKEFHIGHLMSNAIGESLARLLEFSDAEVKRANYQGDVGLHVAKAVCIKQEMPDVSWSKAYVIGSIVYENSPARSWYRDDLTIYESFFKEDLSGYKDKIEEINKKIYKRSDEKINRLYDSGRDISLAYFESIYKRLGTHFDYYFFESETGPFGKTIVEENTLKIFEKSEGATIFQGEKYGLHTRVFVNSEDLPTYEAKELGLAKIKYDKYPYDLSFVVTGNEVRDYFRVVHKAMELVFPEIAAKTIHVPHGMLRLPSGKMSSRTGDVITAESLIDEAKARIMKKMADADIPDKEKVAEEVAIGAIKYSILKHTIGSDIIFDFDASLSFEGDSGPYLQYAYVRAKSVVNKARESGVSPALTKIPDGSGEVPRMLYQFPEVVSRANSLRAPSHVVTYLTLLAQTFNNFYAHERIADSPYRLALAEAVATVLKNGLWILGIKAPERM